MINAWQYIGIRAPVCWQMVHHENNTSALSLGSFPHVVIDSDNHDEAKRFHI